jgi:hypothetical protein
MSGTLNETCTDHVKGEDFFTITAAEQWSIAMVHRLQEKFPEAVAIEHSNPDGSMVARLPFAWMRIVPKKHVSENNAKNLRGSDGGEENKSVLADTPAWRESTRQ